MIRSMFMTLLAAAMLLVGCNTVQGIGRDIEKGGEAIQKAVK
ncbi:entericidin [Denitratisoma oestradiolicum]|nr:entericidin [Denitratisoma oestradiolicum]